MSWLNRTTALVLAAIPAALTQNTVAQETVAIRAGKVHTITQGTLEDAVILVENGRIAKIGKDIEPGWDARVIDASDKVVLPTYVLAHTSGGMNSANERMPNVPYLTVADGIDPSSRFFEEALRNGVGTIHILPGNDTLLGGLGMIVRPSGRTIEDMAVRTTGGMKLSLEASSGGRMAHIRKMRRALEEVREYVADRKRREEEFEKEKEVGATEAETFEEEIDEKKKPVVDLLAGKHVAFLYVPSSAEIPEAIRMASGNEFETVLVLGPSCHKAARMLSGLDKPVILDARLEYYDTDPETEDETLVCSAGELTKLGIPFALSIDAGEGGSSSSRRYPWWQMATAIRHGMSRSAALESMTIVPARILGLDDEIGSIEEGKVANLQIVTDDPLRATSWVEKVMLEGAVVYEREKDPRLTHLFGKDAAEGSTSR